MDADSIREFALWIKAGALTAFGGLVGYLIEVQGGRPFSWFAYMTFILAAFMVGQVLDGTFPESMPGRGGLLMVAGTIAHPLLSIFQEYLVTLAYKITGKRR